MWTPPPVTGGINGSPPYWVVVAYGSGIEPIQCKEQALVLNPPRVIFTHVGQHRKLTIDKNAEITCGYLPLELPTTCAWQANWPPPVVHNGQRTRCTYDAKTGAFTYYVKSKNLGRILIADTFWRYLNKIEHAVASVTDTTVEDTAALEGLRNISLAPAEDAPVATHRPPIVSDVPPVPQ